ncbi:MAG: hypothetical protein WBO17_06315 [Sphingorhabdus sp.]
MDSASINRSKAEIVALLNEILEWLDAKGLDLPAIDVNQAIEKLVVIDVIS